MDILHLAAPCRNVPVTFTLDVMTRSSPVLAWTGILAIGCVWSLALRLVWEQTVWTWERGAQMVGFSLMHSGAGLLLLIATYVSVLWVLATLIVMFRRRRFGDKRILAILAVYGLGWLLLCTPYGFWQRIFISKFTPAQGIELLSYAAADGDLRTVRAFLDAGVPVNAQSAGGTALHAAAMNGQVEVLEYLISRGAEVNAVNAYGDSALITASGASERSAESEAVLSKHGAVAIKGSKEQRAQAAERRLRELMQQQKDVPR